MWHHFKIVCIANKYNFYLFFNYGTWKCSEHFRAFGAMRYDHNSQPTVGK